MADLMHGNRRGSFPGTRQLPSQSGGSRSARLPSIDSPSSGSNSLSPYWNNCSPEEDAKSVGTNSEFSFGDLEEFGNEEKPSQADELGTDGMLTKKDIEEIEKKVDEKFREDFRKIWREAKHKEMKIKRGFKKVIVEARATLVEARVDAEIQAVNKLEERAEEKQSEIMKKRSLRKWTILEQAVAKDGIKEHNFGAGDKWVREQVEEMATLRKIQSDLDRARVRRKASTGAVVFNTRKGKVRKLVKTVEMRRLEKVDEIQNLIQELSKLGLHEHADTLQKTMESKEHANISLRHKLKEERVKARIEALAKKEKEVEKLRRERIAEMERLEEERKAREEREKHARIMAALARKAHNQTLRRSFDQTLLASKISRSQTFSYFPPP